jgi:dienelactone hydrolase
MAEMGLAAVGMEYCQTNEEAFDAQLSALLNYLRRQPWADTNRVAWAGFSLGAQRSLDFALRQPDLQPKLMVRLAGGWVPELPSEVQSLKSKV